MTSRKSTRIRRRIKALTGLAAAGLLLGLFLWGLSSPTRPEATLTPDYAPDLANGERAFHAGGCASCHAVQHDEEEGDGDGREGPPRLGGGLEMASAYGSFVVPNISPHPDQGIGGWQEADFVAAMQQGVSPSGRHYYPAFPYSSYTRAAQKDVRDLFAYLKTLPPVDQNNPESSLDFPWSLRRGIGLWKRVYLGADWVVAMPAGLDEPDLWKEGRDLVEGLGHCGECHTPRTALGALDLERWLAGAPVLDGDGNVPSLRNDEQGLGDWSLEEIAYYLESGFTPAFDVAGGEMASVVENTARLTDRDRRAIATYLKSLRPDVPQ